MFTVKNLWIGSNHLNEQVIYMALAVSLSLISCSNPHPLQKAQWLIGTWENITEKGSSYETWKMENEDELSAVSYALQGQDTLVFEAIKLVSEEDTVFYVPTISDQNEGLPVRFTLKKMGDSEILFENPDHDFPNQISYKKTGKDSLVATISGIRKGKKVTRLFPMRRIR